MENEVLVALITGGLALAGNIISNRATTAKIQQQIIVNQAVTDTKIEELTREVREHNDFARRVPVLEREMQHVEHDIDELKEYHK